MNLSDDEPEILMAVKSTREPCEGKHKERVTATALFGLFDSLFEARARIRELENELKEVTSEARVKIKESSIDSWGF